ncbi:MAG: hypothetical protein F4Z34_01660 [Acidimicrobiaceae bacterium]|nr:hypothetical protein [Acidimicrobiaceae bacterium]MYB28200.1 hypothetical protein [Acidimicrobiaceae bacterium]
MIAVVLLASPLGGAAVTGVVLRWHEIQQSRSAVTSAIATTSLPSAGETQNDIEPPENDFGTTHHEATAPPTTVPVTYPEAEIAIVEDRTAATVATETRLATEEAARRAAEEALQEAMRAAEDAHLAMHTADPDVVAMAGSALYDAIDAQDWLKVVALLTEAETRTATLRVHPNVHDEGVARLEAVVARYESDWPWVRAAWDASDVRFYDPQLPGTSAPAAAVTATPGARTQLWFTLNVLRPSDGPFAEPRRLDNTLLHELGHAWNNGLGGGDWPLVQAQFYEHYAGCRGYGLASDDLREELLVDAMVMITRHITHRGPGWHNGNFVAWEGYYDSEGNRYGDAFGYYDAGGFTGCLADGASPPQHLMDAIREALLHNSHTKSTQ